MSCIHIESKTVIIQKGILDDLKPLIKKYNVSNKPKLKIDVTVYFLSLFNSIPSYYREEEQTNQVSLDSQILKRIHGKYNKYLDFLLEFDFIKKIYNHGADINRCNIFKMLDKYLFNELTPYKITDKTILKKFNNGLSKNQLDKNLFCKNNRPHLVKFFDKNLSIDSKAAYNEIKNLKNNKDTVRKYISNSVLIFEFYSQEWKYSIKPKSDNRLHTNLTRSAKILRKHIRYNDKPIIGGDLKTSQPFFLCVVIKAILLKKKDLLEQIKATDILSEETISALFNLELDREELIRFVQTVLNRDLYNEFEELLEIDYDEDGKPYRMVSNITNKKKNRRQNENNKPKRKVVFETPRDLVKGVIMEIFYSKPNTTVKEAVLFRKQYPSVHKVFKCLHECKVKFSYLMQYIEAYVLLDYAAKKIHEANPKMPLFSIHDALATTVEWQSVLMEEMSRHIKVITTIQPKLDIEDWK